MTQSCSSFMAADLVIHCCESEAYLEGRHSTGFCKQRLSLVFKANLVSVFAEATGNEEEEEGATACNTQCFDPLLGTPLL